MKIRTNLVANFFGNAWNAILTILVTPVQVTLLGVEAFGLISFIAVLQVVVGALDFGLAAAVTRQLALSASDKADACKKLVRSVGSIYWILSILILAVLFFSSSSIAYAFIKKTSTLDVSEQISCLKLIGFYIAIRWPVAFYSGVISGLHKFKVLNVIRSFSISLRLLGGVIVLLINPNIFLLLGWYVLTALLELIAMIYFAYRNYNFLSGGPIINFYTLEMISKFSFQMYGIALLSVLLTQLDRILISYFLGLESLGYYSVAYGVAIGLSLIQMAINSVAMPSLSAAYADGDVKQLARLYEQFCEIMSFIVIPCTLLLVVFSYPLLTLWVGPDTALMSNETLIVLAVGFMLTSIFSNIYSLSVACGRPSLFLRANIIGLLLYVPFLIFALNFHGFAGAAYAWVALNMYYLFVTLPKAHRDLKMISATLWAFKQVIPFLLSGIIAFGIGRLVYEIQQSIVTLIAGIGIAMLLYLALAYRVLSNPVRHSLNTFALSIIK